jgi:hypothetical protein
MPHTRFDWHERIKAVEREYWSARAAVDRLSALVVRDPNELGEGLRPRDVQLAAANLEGTYLIRMFAEFGTGLRSFWKTLKPRAHPRMEVLLESVAARCRTMPDPILEDAHRVRKYRNKLVHERDEEIEPVTINEGRSHLAKYLARLPMEW